jgi:protein TonB
MPNVNGERESFELSHRRAQRPSPWRRARMRGAVSPKLLIALAIVVIAVVAGWWFLGRDGGTALTLPTPGASAPTQTTAENAGAPAAQTELTVSQLYGEARKAMSDNRMVAPPGNNALEFYLRILAQQPDNANAKDALRELFPFATAGVEDQINQNNVDEATRIMDLLAKADPSNYTLTILRSKMDAKKKQNDRELALKAQQDAAAAAAAAAAARGTAPPAAEATAAAAPVAAPAQTAEHSAAAAQTPKPATEVAKATPPPAPVPAAPSGESRDVRVVTAPRPTYPPAAARNRQHGWVEVEFTVAANGEVQNAHVVASQPARVFDREAVRAVENAKFDPKLVNGQAVASTLKRRIEFNLSE